MSNEVKAALISAVATVLVAIIPFLNIVSSRAKNAAKEATEKVSSELDELTQRIQKLDVVTAGAVEKDGTVKRIVGYPFTVLPRENGKYRINFRDTFKAIPVVVAISDGGDEGSFAEITSIDQTGFTVEGRTYSGHGLAEIGFQFVAVQATSEQ